MSNDEDLDRDPPKAADSTDLPGRSDDTEDDDDDGEVDRDDGDLDGLDDEGGFDDVVAQARQRAALGVDPDEPDPNLGERPYTAEEAGLRTKIGWGRSPIISVAVIVVGLFLLIATWADFRFFLRSVQSEPRDLGFVSDIYVDGEFTENFDNEWVVLEGDPDVQHAARMQSRDGWIGFMRLIEADASLFVGIPRPTETANNEFPGRFEGRMRRIDKSAQWEKLEVFFNAEELIDVVNLEPAALVAALGSGSAEVGVVDGGAATLGAGDELRLVVRQSTAMAQLGRTTWPTREAAEATLAALGRPWAFIEKRDTVWVFAVEVGVDADLELFQKLTRALNDGDDLATADPKVGGLVLPRRTTYVAGFGDLQVDGPTVSFTYGANTAETGWTVEGQALAPIELQAGRLAVPSAALEAVRLEQPLRANPKGYLLSVGRQPKDEWPAAIMFGAVLGVVLLNGWALATALRRRRAEA